MEVVADKTILNVLRGHYANQYSVSIHFCVLLINRICILFIAGAVLLIPSACCFERESMYFFYLNQICIFVFGVGTSYEFWFKPMLYGVIRLVYGWE